MSKSKSLPQNGRFGWNELVTPNEAAAKKFYGGLLGWKTQPFGNGIAYTLFKQGRDGTGGMYKSPKPGSPAQWIPYIFVDDVEATIKKATKLRGKITTPPFDIPDVGRIAVLTDPQGATFGILKPSM